MHSICAFSVAESLTLCSKFAFVQLGTLISTVVRRIEMRLSTTFPKYSYHVSLALVLEWFECVHLLRFYCQLRKLFTSPMEPRMIS